MKPKWMIYPIIFFIVVAGFMILSRDFMRDASAEGDDGEMNATAVRKPIRAPELNGGTGWLNTDRPIYISNLRGKVILLDFWTYACINCMHVIPDLKKLEAKYSDELVVVGVHSAKHTTEKDTDNIRQAIIKYGIVHPVVNDSEFRIWRSYGVRAWPTLVVINPDGYVAGVVSGEGNYDLLDKVISAIIAEYDKDEKIDRTPLRLALEKNKAPDTLLSYPGKVITNGFVGKEGRLFISDSNNNRIVITDFDGNVIEVIGSGDEGTQDGSFENASFNKPQGMSLDDNRLYIADTENHLIRMADLDSKTVETIAGTGQQGRGRDNGGKALEIPLNSPWDLLAVENRIYIAMAGPHQIWMMDLEDNIIKPYAGSGYEGRLDGKLMDAQLAQPSGITTDGKRLYIADSEASAIRAVDLDDNGNVETIVGVGLFEFGDIDGKGREVRLQHPVGLLYHDGILYVADTFNHKVKILDPVEKTSKTFLGTGNVGNTDGASPTFYEPSGLAIAGDKLYIADTNNSLIRIADLSKNEVSTLVIKGLDDSPMESSGFPSRAIMLPLRKVPAKAKGSLVLNVKFPPGYDFTEGAPLDYDIKPCEGISIDKEDLKKTITNPKHTLTIPFSASNSGECKIKLNLMFNYCDKAKGTCTIESVRWQIPIEIADKEGDPRILIEYKVTPKG